MRTPPTPSHPAVDWSIVERRDGRDYVQVTCPFCGQVRLTGAPDVRRRIREGTFTGCCYKDRLIKRPRSDRIPREAHPAVDWTNLRLVQRDRQRLTMVGVTCPSCQRTRYTPPGAVAAKIRAETFTGMCLPCSPKAPKREWVTLSPGRKVDPAKGYVRLNRSAVPPEHHWIFEALRGAQATVLEHRYTMSVHMGRPLTSDELVDHMDGNKLNNDPSNLRIYRRGRNDPGDTSGYGTFYHEWQLALAEIQRLKAELESCRVR